MSGVERQDTPDDRGLVTVAIASSSFEAHIIAERLRGADIDAFVFDTATAGLGVAFRPGASEIPVQVAVRDRERARAELACAPEPVEDEDGDGEAGEHEVREGNAALPEWGRSEPRMPWPARIAFAITVVVVLVTILGALVMIFL